MVASGDVGVAFAMVCGAGAASSLGASCVFAVKVASPRVLAIALGFAAGVMIYVVFAEILSQNAIDSFQDAGYSGNAAYRLATACFFGGMLATAALEALVHQLMHFGARYQQRRIDLGQHDTHTTTSTNSQAGLICSHSQAGNDVPRPGSIELHHQHHYDSAGCDTDVEMGSANADPKAASCCSKPELCCRHNPDCCGACCAGSTSEDCCGPTAQVYGAPAGEAAQHILPGTAPAEVVAVLQSDPHTRDLLRMSIVTGLAIALHNVPEGLATFVGALEDSEVGASIAVAIAIHNIPEGICVAMPIYYATGSKWKAFFWGSLTGLAEPLGGLLGYLVLSKEEPLSFGIVFSLVAGMMVFVSFKELLPSAFRFDAIDRVVSTSVIVGMAVMAASLLLFTL